MINQSTPRFQTEVAPRSALRIPKPIDVVQIQATATTVYTARADADFQIVHLVASNVSASSSWITIHLVPDGGSASAANKILHQVTVGQNNGETIFNSEHQGLLQPGMSIQALCQSNDDINMFGYGFDYQGEYS